jgi:sulfotransferase
MTVARDGGDRYTASMNNGLHFISGLPRSGSTLLSALLRQNPRFHAGMTSPVGSLFNAMLREVSQGNETAVFIDDTQRTALLWSVFDAYYADIHPTKVVFDTNRLWTTKLPSLTTLFPDSKMICCVRHVSWIMDSIERLIRRNRFELSKIFNFEAGGTVYSRVDGLSGAAGMVGFAWNALREAVYGEHADRLILVTYDTLTANPLRALREIYDFIGEPQFTHDPDNVSFDEAAEFDARLGTPGLHSVSPAVRATERKTLLPPDLFSRFEQDAFWRDLRQLPSNLRVV